MNHDDTAYLFLGADARTSRTNYALTVPYPSAGKAGFTTSRMVNSARNAKGTLVGRMVGRSLHKQELGWDKISCQKWWELNRWFEQGHFTFYCHLFNHNLGRWETRLFYLGDVKTQPCRICPQTGEPAYYRNASFSVIDCGVI